MRQIQISAKVSEAEKALIDEYCKGNDITIAQLIRKAIRVYLRDQREKKKEKDILDRYNRI